MKQSRAYVYVLIIAMVVLGLYRAGTLLSAERQMSSAGGVEQPDSDYVPAPRVLLLRDEDTEALVEELRWEAAPLPRKTGRIVSFDRSETGELLVAFTGGRLAVYGPDFQLLHSFRFRAKKYFVQWYGESIRLVLPKEEAVLDFTVQGELMRGRELSDYYPQNQAYLRALRAKNVCSTEEGGYRLENGFWWSRFFYGSYDRLVEERNGKRRVLLEAGKRYGQTGKAESSNVRQFIDGGSFQ